jgi:hypothetical protein
MLWNIIFVLSFPSFWPFFCHFFFITFFPAFVLFKGNFFVCFMVILLECFFKRKLFPPTTPPPPLPKKKSVVFFQILKHCLDHHQPTNKLFFLNCFFMFRAILEEHQPLSFIILNFYGAFLTMSLSSYYILNIYPFLF